MIVVTPKKVSATTRAAEPLRKLKGYIGGPQLRCVQSLLRGEEGDFFADKMIELAATVEEMPKLYEQDGKGDDAIVYLHYFRGSADWWILEKSDEAGSTEVYGYADLFKDGFSAELGYIDVADVSSNAELDFHWRRQTLGEVKKGQK